MDTVRTVKAELPEHVLRLRDLKARMDLINQARADLTRDLAQAKREDVNLRTDGMAVQGRVRRDYELELKCLREGFAAFRAKDRASTVIEIGKTSS